MPIPLPFDGAAPVATIGDVLTRLREIDARLPTLDGVACFNRVYARMTGAVAHAAAGRAFEDAPFIERLDVVFAMRYLDAIRQDASPDARPSRAWAAVFESRARGGITPLRFAVAGMNAHINFDLALALVETAGPSGAALRPGTVQHRDYLRINDVLAATMEDVKTWLLPAPLAMADAALGQADDAAALFSIFRARDAAWTQAETLWELRRTPRLQRQLIDAQDRFVGLAGRALLAPALPNGRVK